MSTSGEAVWTGYHNTEMTTFPASGSFFDPDSWQDGAIPGSGDRAILGRDTSLANGNAQNDPHYLYFGNSAVQVPA